MSAQTNNAAEAGIRRYVSLLESGSADDLVALFAENATVEDPVGGDIRCGHEAIRDFFTTLQDLDRHTEVNLVRVAPGEAAFVFTITFTVGDVRMQLQPIDTVTFNDRGEITSLRSYFDPSNVTPV
ncbi:nuclear transport factor 2 family protein [Mycolicibacterium austroafricanum]|uniref:nuclear transport factor 2 family protein n=1 Tax=Mycolicibacterium austroafricanum TaxID=39687 RepID=UPI001CA38373|nr:nuclear transport factor 2 family protein [Mycolicibacterium austroafricanum]QZT64757.1 nuclear transport factor 2 family protein [Mycolicibacterium austroafricanum]